MDGPADAVGCSATCSRGVNGISMLYAARRDGDGEGDVGDLGLVKYRVSTYTSDVR